MNKIVRTGLVLFNIQRGPDGKVRTGVWDRVCVPGGVDRKDGSETQFTLETMSQMVDNFSARGDKIALDWNHQSQHASTNGQPAPAMAFYGALAVVEGGKVVKMGTARGIEPTSQEGLDLSLDGLWCYRCEVTEIGDQLLPGFLYTSPTFTPEGERRDGTPCGYFLASVAATNTPFQEATVITFSHDLPMVGESSKKEGLMSPEMLSKLGLAEDCSPEAMGEAFAKYMGGAEEKMAKLSAYEDAEKAKLEAPAEMPQMDSGDADDKKEMADDEEKKEMEKDDGKDEAKMAVMEASFKALSAEVASLKAEKATREAAAKAENERRFEQLADQAIAGGYPKEAKAALVKFARTDLDGARASVAHFLPKKAPSYLFDRASNSGAPIGKSTENREMSGAVNEPRVIKSGGRRWIETDATFAGEVKKLADSKDPVLMEKLDKYMTAEQRPQTFYRLLAADKIVRAEHPELVPADER